MQNNKINYYVDRDFGEILNTTIAFVRQNYKIILKTLLYYTVPLAAIMGVITGIYYYLTLSGSIDNPAMSNVALIAFVGLLMVIVSFALFTLLPSLLFSIMQEYKEHGPGQFTVQGIWSGAKKNFANVLGTTFIIIGLVLVGVFILIIPVMSLPWLTVFLVTPFMYAMVTLYFLYPVRVFEDNTTGESISRAFYLIKGNWWWSFLLYMVVSMAVGMIGFIFFIPQYVYIFFVSFTSASGGAIEVSQGITIFTSILTMIGQVLIYSLPFVALSLQYFNLVEKKDKISLLSKIDDILPTENVE